MKYWYVWALVTVLLGNGCCLESWFPYKECGGVLPISVLYSTTIEYKLEEKYSPLEFCVWTLLPQENVRGVRLEITQMMATERDGIVAYFWNSTCVTGVKLPGNNTNIMFDTPVSFLAFSSDIADGLESNGFRIIITSIGTPGPTIARAYHIEKSEGEFSYPGNKAGVAQQYENNDRVSIIVKRQFDVAWQMKEIKLQDVDIEPNSDYVTVYVLAGYWDTTTSVLVGNVTGAVDVSFSVNSIYPTLFLFTSDQKTTGKGFTIQWKNFPYKVDL